MQLAAEQRPIQSVTTPLRDESDAPPPADKKLSGNRENTGGQAHLAAKAPQHETAPVGFQIADKSPAAIPLSRPGRNARSKQTGDGLPPLASTLGSLGLTIAAFLVVAWCLKRTPQKGATLLPAEVVETLGRAPLPGKQQMHLIRCGQKLLLVCVSHGNAETLTEITDPREVDRLSGLCREAHPESTSSAFAQVFAQLHQDRGHREGRSVFPN